MIYCQWGSKKRKKKRGEGGRKRFFDVTKKYESTQNHLKRYMPEECISMEQRSIKKT